MNLVEKIFLDLQTLIDGLRPRGPSADLQLLIVIDGIIPDIDEIIDILRLNRKKPGRKDQKKKKGEKSFEKQ